MKEIIWGVLDDHVVEYPKENYEIELQGFLLINFYPYEGEKDWVSIIIYYCLWRYGMGIGRIILKDEPKGGWVQYDSYDNGKRKY